MGNRVRFGVDAHGIYLYSGTPTGQSKSPFGTLPAGATFAQQSTGGLTGEFQLSSSTFGLDLGATPQGFPVQNVIGGMRLRPLGGPITFMAVRDSVKDSLLSYAGVRDPGTGVIWCGVASDTGTVQIDHKGTRNGGYANVSFSYLAGKNVPNNWNTSGAGGMYFTVVKGLTVGLSVNGMHYDKNLSFFSLGQGGYFSPQQYGPAAIPITWFSRHKRFVYEIHAGLGPNIFLRTGHRFSRNKSTQSCPPRLSITAKPTPDQTTILPSGWVTSLRRTCTSIPSPLPATPATTPLRRSASRSSSWCTVCRRTPTCT